MSGDLAARAPLQISTFVIVMVGTIAVVESQPRAMTAAGTPAPESRSRMIAIVTLPGSMPCPICNRRPPNCRRAPPASALSQMPSPHDSPTRYRVASRL
jgi:hypothetical protein